jgi:hypothetical protein
MLENTHTLTMHTAQLDEFHTQKERKVHKLFLQSELQ